MMITINANLTIPSREIRYTYGTSSGPGGQHVNKVETKVTLLFDVLHSASITEHQRKRLFALLATRINKRGVLRVTSSKHRSQKANRETVNLRFGELVQEVLRPRKSRKKASVSTSQKRRRLDEKRKRSELKRLRGRVHQ